MVYQPSSNYNTHQFYNNYYSDLNFQSNLYPTPPSFEADEVIPYDPSNPSNPNPSGVTQDPIPYDPSNPYNPNPSTFTQEPVPYNPNNPYNPKPSAFTQDILPAFVQETPNPAISQNSSEKAAHAKKGLPNLEDECPICLDSLEQIPEGDKRQVTILSQTNCEQKDAKNQTIVAHHFFHDFCLKQHLETAKNHDCPMCRTKLDDSKITKIDLNELAAEQALAETKTPVKSQGTAAKAAGFGLWVLKGAVGSLKWTASKLGSAAYSAIFTSNKERQKALQERTVDLFAKWESGEKALDATVKTNKENLAVLLGTINSLPVEELNKAKAALERVAKFTKVYEQKKQEIQNVFNKFIDEELKKFLPTSQI